MLNRAAHAGWHSLTVTVLFADYVCNFLLVDPSTDGMQRPVEMLLFAKEQWQLPNVQKPGDIIRLHRIKVRAAWG